MINRYLARLSLLVTLFLLALSFSGYAQADTDKVLLQEMVTMMDLVEKDPSYWPGFKVNSKPMVIGVCHDEGDQQSQKQVCGLYAFNFKPNSNNWKKLTVDDHNIYYSANDAYGITTHDYDYNDYESFEPSTALIKKPYTMIDGQLSYVYTIYLNRYGSNTELLQNTMNMLGGRLQAHMLTDAPNAKARLKLAFQRMHAGYTGFRETSNVTLLYIETQLMKSYLNRPNEETLKNFVAIERIRKAAATEQMLSYEYSDLAPFGIYPYARMTGQSTNVLKNAVWLPPLNDEQISSPYFSLLGYTNQMISYISAASTVALENTDSSWKATANAQLVSMQELLMERYAMPQDEINRRANAMKLTYDFDVVKKRLEEKLQPSLSQVDAELKNYQNMPGVVTHVVFSVDPNNGYSYIGGYSNYIIDSETSLIINQDGSGTSIGDPVIFGFSNLKYIKSRSNVENSTRVLEFKLPSEATINIDGVTSTIANLLAAKQKTVFKLINIKGSVPSSHYPVTVTVGSEKGGIIDATGETLEITR